MNAAVITADVMSMLRKRYGKPAQLSKGQVFTFGTSATFSISYSKLLRGDKFFYAVSSAMTDPATIFPKTELGEFALFICGSGDKILIIPRSIIIEMLEGVPTRRVDIFKDADSLILQTTKHPKLDVTEFLNLLPSPKRAVADCGDGAESNPHLDRLHVKIQWSLIKLGMAEGCSVWVPVNDRNLSYQGMPFSRNTVEKLPNFGFEENTRRIVQNIDVLWLKKNVIRKAFEIESTTSIYSGLLRLNDLALSQPNNQIELFIAASERRKTKVYEQLLRPSFQSLLCTCKYVTFEYVERQTERLASFGGTKGVRVSGLIEGELFRMPRHLVSPAHLE